MTLDDRMREARDRLDARVASVDVPPNKVAGRSRHRTQARLAVSAAALVVLAAVVFVAAPRGSDRVHVDSPLPGNVGPFIPDINDPTDPHNVDSHWHAALGVFDCDHWVGDSTGVGLWQWPAATPTGAPGRAIDPNVYAGLHSHADGIIHMEPATPDDAGANATLGQYFDEGGWTLSTDDFTFVGTTARNGETCNGAPGQLRWWVNGQPQTGDPAAYKLENNDVIVLAFTSASADYPGTPPSAANLPASQGVTPTTNAPSDTFVAGPLRVRGSLRITVAPGGLLIFEPNELNAQVGVYELVLDAATFPHDLNFDDPSVLGRDVPIESRDRQTVRAVFAHAGDYTFSCLVAGHAEAGMRGVVHVTDG